MLAAVLAGLLWLPAPALARGDAPGNPAVSEIEVAGLPAQARSTIALIRQGGPFPYVRDGAVFGNFEKQLPPQPRGYYREYTVPTPGATNRGASWPDVEASCTTPMTITAVSSASGSREP